MSKSRIVSIFEHQLNLKCTHQGILEAFLCRNGNNSPEPTVEIHNVNMYVLKALSILRFNLLKVGIILFQRNVSSPFVCYDCSFFVNISFKERFIWISRSTSNSTGNNFQGNYDEFPIIFTSTLFTFFFSDDIEFINMNYSADRMKFTTCHSLLDFPFELPASLLT